jgi:hypothetical protein
MTKLAQLVLVVALLAGAFIAFGAADAQAGGFCGYGYYAPTYCAPVYCAPTYIVPTYRVCYPTYFCPPVYGCFPW